MNFNFKPKYYLAQLVVRVYLIEEVSGSTHHNISFITYKNKAVISLGIYWFKLPLNISYYI